MDRNRAAELLRYASRRASRHPFFLAADIEHYRVEHDMEEAKLAQFLGCAPESLPKLALCRRPDPESPAFQADIRRIAEAFNLEAPRLVQVVREIESLKAFSETSQDAMQDTGRGLLLAARDVEGDEDQDRLDSEIDSHEQGNGG